MLKSLKAAFKARVNKFGIILLLIFFTYPLITVSWSLNPSFGFYKWLNLLLSTGGVILVIFYLIITYTEVRGKLFVFIILSIALISIPFVFIVKPFYYDGTVNIFNLQLSHVIYGRFLGVAALLSLYLIFGKQLKPVLNTAVLIIILFGLYFTGLRAALTGIILITGLTIIRFLYKEKSLKPLIISLGSAVIIGLLVFYFSEYLPQQRYYSLTNLLELEYSGDSAIDTRIELYSKSIKVISNNNFMGDGFGGFNYGEQIFKDNKYPHNIFLETIIELGLPGLAIIITLIFLIFLRSYRISFFLFIFYLFAFWLALFSKDIPTQSFLFSGLVLLIKPVSKE
ncbi:MAG: O-antigen ligase family protein [Ignavibacteriaceae bacterium]